MTVPPLAGRPNGYDRCDALFCNPATRPNGNYFVSPCSRLFCNCNAGKPTWHGCQAGYFYDKTTNACRAQDATFCPAKAPVTTASAAILWTNPAPAAMATFCNAANCDGRGVVDTWYTLDLCTPYWCYCWQTAPTKSRAVQTCPAGQYFDFRAEVAACVGKNALLWCWSFRTSLFSSRTPFCSLFWRSVIIAVGVIVAVITAIM